MNARDELAELLYEEALSGRGYSAIAATILAAGYRKPRTITTVAELDGLAEGSVILSNGGEDSAQKDGEGYWYLWGGDVGLDPGEIMLPATVLHNPDEAAA